MPEKKAVWIDVDNSPHVPLFAPIIADYRARGVEVILTARNHSQTIELLEKAGFGGTFEIVGKHYGKSKINKIAGLLVRAKQLISYIKLRQNAPAKIKVAVSHGSRSMVLAARWLNIPIVTMYDYEFTETTIFNRFSDEVLIPDQIPNETLQTINLPAHKRVKYSGYKEELYLKNYRKDASFRRKLAAENDLDFSDETILVALRPPATTANYHHAQSENLFRELLQYVLNDVKTFTVILPRTCEQRLEIENLIGDLKLKNKNYFLPERALDGLDLACAADLLISGGGTMNREAALLGVPVYSIFAGKQGALDRAMEQSGLIVFVRETEDLKKILLIKKDSLRQKQPRKLGGSVERILKERINYWLDKN